MSRPADNIDLIAREAARLLHQDDAMSIRDAIARAAERIDACARRPGPGRVRMHLQAMVMQSLGEAGYRAHTRGTVTAALELMTLFTEMTDDMEPLLVGRAARGMFDGPGALHMRVYTAQPIDEVAALLEHWGYMITARDSVNTRYGRLNRLHITDDGISFTLTRCLPAMRGEASRNLFRDEPIATASIHDLGA